MNGLQLPPLTGSNNNVIGRPYKEQQREQNCSRARTSALVGCPLLLEARRGLDRFAVFLMTPLCSGPWIAV